MDIKKKRMVTLALFYFSFYRALFFSFSTVGELEKVHCTIYTISFRDYSIRDATDLFTI